MRKLVLSFTLLLVFCSVLVLFPKSQVSAGTEDFVINSFITDFYINKDSNNTSTLDVREQITVQFPDFDQNHGIYRSIPNRYQKHTTSLEINSVTDQFGYKYEYSKSNKKDFTILKIGDADKYVRGKNIYIIKYSLKNVINFQDLDEFYWDVNGADWKQPINQVKARLHVPTSLASNLSEKMSCYAGNQGSKLQNCEITTDTSDTETIITTTAVNLKPKETLTIVSGFSSNTFVLGPEVAADERKQRLLSILLWPAIVIPSLLSLIVMYPKWLKKGRDPKGRGVIIPEYVAPKNLNLLQSSYILNEKISPQAFSAELINLAVLGYLKISEIEKGKFFKSKDYEIEIVKDTSTLSTDQRDLLSGLFSGSLEIGTKTNITSSSSDLSNVITKINDNISSNLGAQGYFVGNPKKVKEANIIIVVALIGIGIGFFWIFIPLAVGLILAGIIVQIFSYLMSARTRLGVEQRDYLLGLKEYIKLAEADRINYLQSPQGVEKTPIDSNDPKQQIKLFESLLPFAMIFKLEKQWAEQFKDLYTQPPTWYSGNFSTFNTATLADSIGSFNDINSASSGFSGGGSAGGGGGGGGGGGW